MTKDNGKDERPFILLTGNAVTRKLAAILKDDYQIAVLDARAAREMLSMVDPIACPANAISPLMRQMTTNDVAILAARVVQGIGSGLLTGRFGLDGLDVPELTPDGLGTWLPGLVLGHLSDLVLHLRALETWVESGAKIVAIVTHEDVTPLFKMLVLWGKSTGIPTFHIPHAANCFVQVRPDIHDTCSSDYNLVATPWMKEWYAERGYPEDRMEVVGFPGFDGWLSARDRLSRGHARKVVLLEDADSDRPVVMYCTSWPQWTNLVAEMDTRRAANNAILEAARENNWRLIWSLHPGDPPQWQKEYYDSAEEAGVDAIVIRGHLPYSLMASDAVVAFGPSNVLVEAGIADRPPITVRAHGASWFPTSPPFEVEPDASDIGQTVNALIDDRSVWDKMRDDFLARYAGEIGGASERIAEAIKARL